MTEDEQKENDKYLETIKSVCARLMENDFETVQVLVDTDK